MPLPIGEADFAVAQSVLYRLLRLWHGARLVRAESYFIYIARAFAT